MPIYNNALTQRPSNMLAYQDTLSATPRNQVLGYLADLAAASYAPQRTQQMQGMAQFLSIPAVSQTLDRLSYDPSGRSLFTGAGGLGGTTRIRPEAVEAALAVASMAQPMTMATLQASRAATRAAMQAGMTVAPFMGPAARLTKGLPVGMSIKDVGKSTFKKTPIETALLEKSDLIDVTKIKPFNPVEDVGKLDSLTASMKKNGWQGRPILAYDIGDGFEALTGSHRIAAAKKAGIKDIPVIKVSDDIANYTDDYGRNIRDISDEDDVVNFLKDFGDKDASQLMNIEQKYNRRNLLAAPVNDPLAGPKQSWDAYAAQQVEKGFGVQEISGTRNFVVFPGEEKSMTILERNGQPANALVKGKTR